MISLMVVVLLLEVVVHLINAIGTTTINNLVRSKLFPPPSRCLRLANTSIQPQQLWRILILLPIGPAQMAAEKRKLQTEYLAVRKEMLATSSQDEFAKWARLRRKHDKLYEGLEKKKQSFDAVQAQYNTIINAVRLLITRAPQYIIPFWFSREPMFWLPKNLFPYYAEWFLSLPKAPLGSVSIGTWQVSCALAIKLVSDILVAIATFVATSVASKKKVPVGVPADAQPSETETVLVEEKKEL
ncbi:Protein get-1 [Ceratocystis lukuohia]|uniref:Protein get-1 n=1 Tax=Ceratocystis lukuohia TaxID=2019550 RepID=A0ABR4MSX2_9PEZI